MRGIIVERHRESHCPDIDSLCSAGTAEGHMFVDRTRGDWVGAINRFDRSGECFFVARRSGLVVGMCGVNVDPYLNDASVGRLRHLYVHPDHRRSGVAKLLVAACQAAASAHFERVRLRTPNPDADAFYEAIGFEAVDEAAATHSWHPVTVETPPA